MQFEFRLACVPLARTSAETELDARWVFSPCTSAKREMVQREYACSQVAFAAGDIGPECRLA